MEFPVHKGPPGASFPFMSDFSVSLRCCHLRSGPADTRLCPHGRSFNQCSDPGPPVQSPISSMLPLSLLAIRLLLLIPPTSSAPLTDSLLDAAQLGDLERVRRLVTDADAPDVNVRDTSARTPLIFAAEYGDPAIVQELVSAGADLDSQDMYGWSALHWATDTEHTAAAHELLQRGASVNIGDSDGWSALHWAAYRGFLPLVRELVAGGAEVGQRTRMDRSTARSYTAWDLASMYGHREVAAFLHNATHQFERTVSLLVLPFN